MTHSEKTIAVYSYDRWLLFITIVLIIFGTLMVYSSTSVVTPAVKEKGITEFFYLKKHIFTVLIGIVCMFFVYRLRLSFIERMAIPLMVFSFLLLVFVFVPGFGITVNGATRWIRLGSLTFQPSELVKLSMIIFLAKYMSSDRYKTDSFVSFLKPIFVMAIFQLVILKQRDFGAAMSLALLTLVMLFLSGTRLRYILLFLAFALPVVYKLIMEEPYRLKRIICFLNPWKEPQGCGFQLMQSFIALGSGGITGVGLGNSKQKLLYLPESHTDFIFSIAGEELGFIGVSAVVALFLLLFIRGISIANKAEVRFASYLAVGLSLMISLQVLINLAVTTGMMPTKGLPLPFISYGGSALLVNMVAIGILLNISRGDSRKTIDVDWKTIKMKKTWRIYEGNDSRRRHWWTSISRTGRS